MSIPNNVYSLSWGDYSTSLVSAVQLLRCQGDLMDVTLAAEGRSFEAHKIVLCAASPYLLNLLKVSTAQHTSSSSSFHHHLFIFHSFRILHQKKIKMLFTVNIIRLLYYNK
jgi:hypothetical protein